MPYEVSTPVYEGPFDLLLHLITKEQVDIYEVPLARIVDAYLAEIERVQALDLDVATEFLLIAATLVELKLRRLLPGRDDVDLDDELALLSERDLLIAKLLEYQTFREAAEHLRRLEAAASRSWPRTAGPDECFADLAPDLLAGIDAFDLRDTYAAVIRRALAPPPPPPKVSLSHVHAPLVTVAEVVQELAMFLPQVGRTTLRELTEGRELPDLVVYFLGLLELYKQGWLDLDQPRPLGELGVVWLPDGPDWRDGTAGGSLARAPVPGMAPRVGLAAVLAAVSVDVIERDDEPAVSVDVEGVVVAEPADGASPWPGAWEDDELDPDDVAFDEELDRVLATARSVPRTEPDASPDELDFFQESESAVDAPPGVDGGWIDG